MKKFLSISILSLVLLLSFSQTAFAISCSAVPGADQAHIDADKGLVPCGQFPDCQCELSDVFKLALRVYTFIVWTLSPIIAGFLVVAGGLLILLSGINNSWYAWGKGMLWGTFIGLLFVFGSYLIISIAFQVLGYTSNWFSLTF